MNVFKRHRKRLRYSVKSGMSCLTTMILLEEKKSLKEISAAHANSRVVFPQLSLRRSLMTEKHSFDSYSRTFIV